MKSILFVCMGNICRSPTGEAVLRALVRDRGLEVEVDSAGTTSYHVGEPADSRMRHHASLRGFDLTSIARQISRRDFDRFDRVIAMDRDNLEGILKLSKGGEGQVRLFSEYLDDRWPVDVPDPYYGGDEGFERVLDMIEAGGPAILDDLLEDLPEDRG